MRTILLLVATILVSAIVIMLSFLYIGDVRFHNGSCRDYETPCFINKYSFGKLTKTKCIPVPVTDKESCQFSAMHPDCANSCICMAGYPTMAGGKDTPCGPNKEGVCRKGACKMPSDEVLFR